MSATEELRRLLDERGVEWKNGESSFTTDWQDEDGAEWSAMEWTPLMSVLVSDRTPAQAVEISLGRGKCRLIGYVCSECGAFIGPGASMIIEHRGDDLVISRGQDVNFCPNCGREVER